MNHLIRHPVFYAALLLMLISAATLVSLLRRSLRDVHRLQLKLDRERNELTLTRSPVASGEGTDEASLAAQLADTERQVSDLESTFANGERRQRLDTEPPEPSNSTDAFFDLAVFSERMRNRARAAGVALKTDERFGFAEFAGNGPAKDAIGPVFRQREMMERLLESVFRAAPRELVSVQRSPLSTSTSQRIDANESRIRRATPRGARIDPAASDRTGDYFELEERLSLAVPGLVAATAFRVSFRGQTDTLREVVNELAVVGQTCSVRSVVVTPRTGQEATSVGDAPVSGSRLLVAPADLLFTVTVEFFELISPLQPGG